MILNENKLEDYNLFIANINLILQWTCIDNFYLI